MFVAVASTVVAVDVAAVFEVVGAAVSEVVGFAGVSVPSPTERVSSTGTSRPAGSVIVPLIVYLPGCTPVVSPVIAPFSSCFKKSGREVASNRVSSAPVEPLSRASRMRITPEPVSTAANSLARSRASRRNAISGAPSVPSPFTARLTGSLTGRVRSGDAAAALPVVGVAVAVGAGLLVAVAPPDVRASITEPIVPVVAACATVGVAAHTLTLTPTASAAPTYCRRFFD